MYRISQMFYDMELEPFEIGCGQQFFLLRISETPGITLLELAQKGYYDKGTTARAVKKLEELGYIIRIIAEDDRRRTKLYATDLAVPVVEEVTKTVKKWNDILIQGMSQEEIKDVENLMEKMSDNARQYTNKRKKDKKWNSQLDQNKEIR